MLILCDIDDTIFCYGKQIEDYWKSKINDPGYEIWINIIKQITPRLTDVGIHSFIEEAINKECDIHFITHRNNRFKEITLTHLNHFNLDMFNVHFLAGESKASYINSNFNHNDYSELVFIDDSNANIEDVINNVNNCNVYKFNK